MKQELLLLALRGFGALATAALLATALLWVYLRFFAHRFQQPIRPLGPKSHQAKQGTPIGGGVFILLSLAISALIWGGAGVWWLVLGTLLFGAIGLLDDLWKLFRKPAENSQSSRGIGMMLKLALQFAAAGIALTALYLQLGWDAGLTEAFVPLLGDTGPWPLPLWLAGCAVFLVFVCNAVNLTDGLDGLASFPVALVALGLALLALLADPLSARATVTNLPMLSTEVNLMFVMSLIGAVLAFLWFNTPPARLFMGDTGALALGGALGLLAIVLKQQFLMLLMGGIFVLEGLSVLLQIGWFKWSGGRRIFRMAPFHHHLEALGWSEMRIGLRFWLITMALTALGLALALYTIYGQIAL